MDDQILFIELVPTPIWGVNLRKLLPQAQWRRLRQATLEACEYRCEVCDTDISGKNQAVADEVWEYDTDVTPAMALLETIQGLCRQCDRIKHFGLTTKLCAQGHLSQAYMDGLVEHFCKVNSGTPTDFLIELKLETDDYGGKCDMDWRIDWGEYAEFVPPEVRERRYVAGAAD